ncbi:MAG: hypothetical protein NTV03_03785, partial [Candidatus Nomurabacteria bacterium]|nr:hypothetical protein [Candidatus Nomurabacteria bacterium]
MGSINIGSSLTPFGTIYTDSITANNIYGTMATGSTSSDSWIINSDNATADTENSALSFERGTTTPNALLSWDATNKKFDFNSGLNITNTLGAPYGLIVASGNVGIGITNPQYRLHVVDPTATANGGYNKVFMAHSTGLASGATSQFAWGKADSAYNQAEFNFYYAGDGSTGNQLRLGLNNLPSVITITGTGAIGLNGATTYTTLSGGNITDSQLTAGRVTFAGTAGLLVDDADLTFATDTLSATKLLSSTSVSTPSLISTGSITMTPLAGNNLNVALSTTGDFAVNTSDLYVDTSAHNVGIGTTIP